MGSPTPLAPVLSRFWDDPESWTLETYRRNDGYRALQKALAMEPDAVITAVKDSGLRGRGGAGFSTGTKWSFIPQGDSGAAAKPHYLVVNADESEPGTCKDIPLMLATPHVLVEGVIIASYAIRASHAFIYVRGEVLPVLRRLHNAVAEARKLKIPIVALVDTNCDPDLVDYPIAANDDAIRSVRTIMATVSQAITQANAEFESKRSRRQDAEQAHFHVVGHHATSRPV